MNAYTKIRAALEWGEGPIFVEALAALAELERAASGPVAWMWNDELGIPHASAGSKKPVWLESSASAEYIKQANLRPLYAAPPPAQPAPKFEAPEVDDATADRVHRNYFLAPGATSGAELGHQMISAVRSELGPTLGLVEIREPTPEECERISMAYYDDETLVDRDHYYLGKDMFASVRAVMWPESEVQS